MAVPARSDAGDKETGPLLSELIELASLSEQLVEDAREIHILLFGPLDEQSSETLAGQIYSASVRGEISRLQRNLHRLRRDLSEIQEGIGERQ